MGAGVTRGDDIRRAVRDLNHGYCMLGCGRSASNYARWSRSVGSQGGGSRTVTAAGACTTPSRPRDDAKYEVAQRTLWEAS